MNDPEGITGRNIFPVRGPLRRIDPIAMFAIDPNTLEEGSLNNPRFSLPKVRLLLNFPYADGVIIACCCKRFAIGGPA